MLISYEILNLDSILIFWVVNFCDEDGINMKMYMREEDEGKKTKIRWVVVDVVLLLTWEEDVVLLLMLCCVVAVLCYN